MSHLTSCSDIKSLHDVKQNEDRDDDGYEKWICVADDNHGTQN
jgi:hypothetical protein